MTFASLRAAAQHIARSGAITPHQLAALSALEQSLSDAQKQQFTDLWRAEGSPAAKPPAAAPGAAGLPPEVAQLNHHYEGCRLHAYPDPRTGAEPITIGWGSTFYQDGSPIRLGDVITQAQADALYEHNCREKFWKVLVATIPFWAEMGDRQRAALCSFAYNNGAHFHGDGYHDTLDCHLRDRRWGAVPGSLMMYRNPGERVEVGLGRRRRAEGLVWTGMEPAAACAQAEREIRTPADCETWEQRLKQEAENPKLQVPAQQAPKVKVPAHLRLTRTGKVDSRGLELLRLVEVVDGIPMGELMVVSGAPGRQAFRKGRESRAQSLEPLPEGRYGIEDIEWKGGKDVYAGSWGPGLGPVWVGLNYQAPGKTERSALGIHLDENQGTNPGTAGCVGIRSVADLKRLVAMLRAHDPKALYVDWNLGSCPPVRPI